MASVIRIDSSRSGVVQLDPVFVCKRLIRVLNEMIVVGHELAEVNVNQKDG
jgi:hypothetical protein